ncbi:MAG: M3 family metallopeptidase [Bacteroidia bacterium]|nr:M3 family metallopeptidase [Bacteroidia bacterium]
MNNPLLQKFNTPFNTIPFEEIKLEHYKPAIVTSIEAGKQEIKAIKNNPETPDFKNTIEALERSGKTLDVVSSIFFNLNSSETSDAMQAIAQEVSPLLSAFGDDILMDDELFKRIKAVVETTDADKLSTEQAMLLQKTYKSFVRNGANLDDVSKEKLKELNTKLSKLSLTFGENLLKSSNKFELWITEESDLAGLPEGVKEAALMAAKSKGKENAWLITLDYPSYIPFMMYADVRQLREQLYKAFGSRSFNNDEFNNEEIVKQIAIARHEKANLLNYVSYAAIVLEERMAETAENVNNLLNELLEYAKPIAIEELQEVQNMSNMLGGPSAMERWDFSYYSEKLKNEKFAINDEILKPYFQLEKVIEGAFITAEKLYGITFEKRDDIQTYHKEVTTYEVKDEKGKHLAVFYADFFPRESKRDGAWMTSFSGQNKYDGTEQRPHVSIVCNFTKPTETKPSLLTFNEVTTLFHEFGHALHGIFADGYFESLSGTSVYWDFVELPSQLMENWCYEKECLELFAKHYKTNEVIPIELVQKIKDSANFMSGYQTLRQIGLGRLDLAWHNLAELPTISVSEFEAKATKETDLFPPLKGINSSCAFGHIFQGGYAAGYYSYKWAEVLEADTFEYFLETGIFNKETAKKFKDNILSRGGSEHPMQLYKKFRGQEPSTKPLLRKSGLLKNEKVS